MRLAAFEEENFRSDLPEAMMSPVILGTPDGAEDLQGRVPWASSGVRRLARADEYSALWILGPLIGTDESYSVPGGSGHTCVCPWLIIRSCCKGDAYFGHASKGARRNERWRGYRLGGAPKMGDRGKV